MISIIRAPAQKSIDVDTASRSRVYDTEDDNGRRRLVLTVSSQVSKKSHSLPSTLWVPRILSRYATCTYSWMMPPSRSRRSGRMVASASGGVALMGGR
jgi:hypothetical protein